MSFFSPEFRREILVFYKTVWHQIFFTIFLTCAFTFRDMLTFLQMISARVKDFSQLRRCNAVRFCIWIGSSPFFLYCKVYSYRNGIYTIIFYVGYMASDPQWQEKKWFQNICSIFCWMLTAGSDVFQFWPCEMLSCLCNALYTKCTNCNPGFNCSHKDSFLKTNVVQVSFINAIFLLLFCGMRNAWYMILHFKCDAEKS